MTPITAAMAIAVVTADISIRSRTFASASGVWSGAGSSGFLFSEIWANVSPKTASQDCYHDCAATPTSVLVAAEEAGERLDRVLARHLAEPPAALSRSRLKALIEQGAVALDGKTIRDPSHRVNSGAAIVVDVPPAEPAKPAAEPIPLTVVYEDDDIIVIDKPRNLVVHPAAGHWTGTLVNALIAHCGDSLSGIGGERRPGIVHRLDKDTTGLMVVAKNDRAHRALAAQFADHGRSNEAVRAQLPRLGLGRAGAAARHHR